MVDMDNVLKLVAQKIANRKRKLAQNKGKSKKARGPLVLTDQAEVQEASHCADSLEPVTKKHKDLEDTDGDSISIPSKRRCNLVRTKSSQDSGNGLDPPTPDVCTNKVNSRSSQDEKEEKPQIGMLSIGSTPVSTSQGANACSIMVDVNGYKVKASTAPILEAIFAKHGDIAANCIYKSAAVRSSLVEVVCNVVHRLQSNAIEVIISELKIIQDELSDTEAAKLEVSWLCENLAKMHEVEEAHKRSSLLKEAKANIILLKKAAANKLEKSRVELLAAKDRQKISKK